MRRALPLLVLLLPSLAAAQPMMDPRQMSGIPRPDPQVPAGVITVKVLAGELASVAPVGTPVHLVAMRGKDVKLVTAKVNDEGRAEFTGLDTDGKTAYYALTIFGEDRLISQVVMVPPKVGVRMMLAGRKRDKAGQPIGPRVDDEQQEHEGVENAPPPVPAGDLEVAARGLIDPGAKLVVRELATGKTQEAPLSASEDRLSARVSGLESSPDKVYVAEIGSYRSSPFMMSPQAGARRMILAFDGLVMAVQGGAQPEDEKVWFELSITIANLSSAPFDTGPDGLLVPLPAGFASVNMGDEQTTRFAVESGQGLRYRGSVAPGQLDVNVQFSLPATNGKVSVDMPAPLGIFQSQIYVAKGPGMVVSPPAGSTAAPEIRRADDGREYFMLDNLTVRPGDSLRFDIAGLPVPERWQGVVKLLAGLLVVALVALAVATAVRRPRGVPRAARGAPAGDATRRELGIRRERLYAELVALERARQSQRIDEAAFAAHRRAIIAKLVMVHRELDDLDGRKQASAS